MPRQQAVFLHERDRFFWQHISSMSRLRWLTAGESHGPRLVAIVEGIPAGLPRLAADIDNRARIEAS